jgi:hypothetical protein
MQSDIKFLLLFLVIALVILMYYQHSNNNSVNVNDNVRVSKERFTNNTEDSQKRKIKVDENVLDNLINDINLTNRLDVNGRLDSNGKTGSNGRLGSNGRTGSNGRLDVADSSEVEGEGGESEGPAFGKQSYDEEVADYERESNSINKAPSYRNISYKSSGYRGANFGKNENMPENMSELDKFLEETNVFNDTNENNSSNYSGYDDNNSNLSDNSSFGRENTEFAPANIKAFQANGNSQKDKIMNLYNSNNYLPNESKTNPNLAKGFQILDNPVDVSNPNLIPVLKSIPVSSTLGSKKNCTYDIRAEPPNPKTTISPFLNSDIMPDVYATNRGCL